MELKTTLANSIDVAGDKARYDAYCRELLAEKIILAWIMKGCLDEYRDCDCSVEEIARDYIEGTPLVSKVPVERNVTNAAFGQIIGDKNEDRTMTEGTITFDVRFAALSPVRDKNGQKLKSQIRLLINLEA